MVIPIGDRMPPRRAPWGTRLLLAATLTVFLAFQPWAAPVCEQQAFFLRWAAVPVEVAQGAPLDAAQLRTGAAAGCALAPVPGKSVYGAVLASMFLHADWLHLLGNLLYLWIFGGRVEEAMGRLRFLAFYLVCGLVATAAFVAQNPDSTQVLVGASGAIAGVLGAYLTLFPGARITVTVPLLLFLVIDLPAAVVLGLWFVLQLRELSPGATAGGGVAYIAHVAGFAAGVLGVMLLGRRRLISRSQPRRPPPRGR